MPARKRRLTAKRVMDFAGDKSDSPFDDDGPPAEDPEERARRRAIIPPPGRRYDAPDPDRRRVRRGLGKRWTQMIDEVRAGKYSWSDLANAMDDEELSRGQFRDSSGSFIGRPPALVPREFQLAVLRRLKARFDEQIRGNLLKATEQLMGIAYDGDVPAKDRAAILRYVIERFVGPVPKEVIIHEADPWQTIIDGIVREDGSTATPNPVARRLAARRLAADGSDNP